MKRLLFALGSLAAAALVLLPLPPAFAEEAPAGLVTSAMANVTVDELGEATAEIHARPVNYLAADGRFVPIETALRPAEEGFVNETNTLRTQVSGTYGRGWTVDLGAGTVCFTPVAMGSTTPDGFVELARPNPLAAAAAGATPNTVLFQETYPGISDELTVRPGEIEQVSVVSMRENLPANGGYVSFVYRVTLSEGLTAQAHPMETLMSEQGGVISMPYVEIRDASSKLQAYIPVPHITDSSSHVIAAAGDLAWEPLSPTEGLLTVKVHEGLLDRMTFPVRIDPQLVQVLNTFNITGTSWGHFEWSAMTIAVRFNGTYEVGVELAYFGSPFDFQYVLDCVTTPVFDLSAIPTQITQATFTYEVFVDSFIGTDRVVLNDHKTDATNDLLAFPVFANNIADARNAEPFEDASADFSQDKKYVRCYHDDKPDDTFGRNTSYHLTGNTLHDIHMSQRGEVDTVSQFPLPPGLFALAVRDTSDNTANSWLFLWNLQLTVRYQHKGSNEP